MQSQGSGVTGNMQGQHQERSGVVHLSRGCDADVWRCRGVEEVDNVLRLQVLAGGDLGRRWHGRPQLQGRGGACECMVVCVSV